MHTPWLMRTPNQDKMSGKVAIWASQLDRFEICLRYVWDVCLYQLFRWICGTYSNLIEVHHHMLPAWWSRMGVMFQAWDRCLWCFWGLNLLEPFSLFLMPRDQFHAHACACLCLLPGLPARVGRYCQRIIRRILLHQSTCSSLQDRSLSCKNLSKSFPGV